MSYDLAWKSRVNITRWKKTFANPPASVSYQKLIQTDPRPIVTKGIQKLKSRNIVRSL